MNIHEKYNEELKKVAGYRVLGSYPVEISRALFHPFNIISWRDRDGHRHTLEIYDSYPNELCVRHNIGRLSTDFKVTGRNATALGVIKTYEKRMKRGL